MRPISASLADRERVGAHGADQLVEKLAVLVDGQLKLLHGVALLSQKDGAPGGLKEGPLLAVRLCGFNKTRREGRESGWKWVVLQCDCISALVRRVTEARVQLHQVGQVVIAHQVEHALHVARVGRVDDL